MKKNKLKNTMLWIVPILIFGCGMPQDKSYFFQIADLEPHLITLSSDEFLGIDHVEKGKEYGKELKDNYVAEFYHKPSDEYNPETWNLEGAVEDVSLLYRVGKNLTNSEQWPNWKEGSEFKSIRDSYMKK